jgi:hypothetical protein
VFVAVKLKEVQGCGEKLMERIGKVNGGIFEEWTTVGAVVDGSR